jgi:hypothetical protein
VHEVFWKRGIMQGIVGTRAGGTAYTCSVLLTRHCGNTESGLPVDGGVTVAVLRPLHSR